MMLAVFLFSGCAIHHESEIKPVQDIPDHYNNDHDKTKPHDFSEKWWNKFNDQDLNRVMEDVLANNPDIDQAYYRFVQASSYFKSSESKSFPEIDIKASAGKSRNVTGTTITTYGGSIAASYEIDLWGKIKSSKQSAWFKKNASLEDLKAAYVSITAAAAEIYFKAVEKQAEISLSMDKIKDSGHALEITILNYNEGLIGSDAVYKAKRGLAGAKAELHSARAAYENYIHALATLRGNYPKSKNIINSGLPLPSGIDIDFPHGLPSDLLKNRPDIKSALYAVKAADQEIGVAMANRFPSINLLAEAGISGTDIYGPMKSGNVFNIAGELLAPVLDWGKRKAEVKRAKARFYEILALYKKAVLDGFKDVEDSLINVSTSQEILKQVSEQESLIESDLKQVENKYVNGVASYLSVISLKTAHIDIKKKLAQAKLSLIIQKISLARALGGSWMDEDLKQKKNNF